MNILLLGNGGREHALAWKISQSPHTSKLFIAPGNAGTEQCGQNINIDIDKFHNIKTFCIENDINMIVIVPEIPLVKGIVDYFEQDQRTKDIKIIGPNKKAAMLEGSKDYAKNFMQKHKIPTAAYKTFSINNIKEGFAFLESLKPPYVLKADGLAAGKGVLILSSLQEAKKELKQMLTGSFGEASKKVVIEEFLTGIECSVFILTDGSSYKILPAAKDYKRIGEGNTGLNTGGMGSISPVPFVDNTWLKKVEDQIIKPTIKGLNDEGINYKGFIFFGLINVNGNPKVIEYNCRMGDPECQSVMHRIKSDIVDLFNGVIEGDLSTKNLEIDARTVASIILVSGGYPEKYNKGYNISGIESTNDSIIFHSGTISKSGNILTNGGRVLSISSYGKDRQEALKKCYTLAEKINFKDKYYRKDIGSDL